MKRNKLYESIQNFFKQFKNESHDSVRLEIKEFIKSNDAVHNVRLLEVIKKTGATPKKVGEIFAELTLAGGSFEAKEYEARYRRLSNDFANDITQVYNAWLSFQKNEPKLQEA